MKTSYLVLFTAVVAIASGCASTQSASTTSRPAPPSGTQSRYVATDRRTIDIGRSSNVNGGRTFKNPHLDSCWIADDFNFTGYDTLYIVPTQSTAKYNTDEEMPHDKAKKKLANELAESIGGRGLFANVVTKESDIKPGARVLKMENTIVEYAKGGGGARYWAGIYGAGQPMFRVQGKIVDGNKSLFTYEGRRSGVSGTARMFGAFKTDIDIQLEDIRSFTLDLSDFMAAVGGKYQAKK